MQQLKQFQPPEDSRSVHTGHDKVDYDGGNAMVAIKVIDGNEGFLTIPERFHLPSPI